MTIRVWSNPLHIEPVRNIIIDTDCAIDDMRAISLLLSQPGIIINAILLSDGSLAPNDGIEKVMTLLHEFNRDTIPVAPGKEIKGLNPPWRQFNRQLSWGRTTGSISPRTDAAGLLYEKLDQEKKTILVCLGPLTNIAQLIRENDSIASKIERIVWYNESVEPLKGFKTYKKKRPYWVLRLVQSSYAPIRLYRVPYTMFIPSLLFLTFCSSDISACVMIWLPFI